MGVESDLHHDFAHNQKAVLACAVWIEGLPLENAVAAFAFSLLRAGTVESPQRTILNAAGCLIDDLGLTTRLGSGR